MIFSLFEIIKFYLNSTYPAADLNFIQGFFLSRIGSGDFGFWKILGGIDCGQCSWKN